MSLSHRRFRRPAWLLVASLLAAGLALAPAALADSGTQFIRSAVVNGDHTATLPLLRGTSGGQTVWYLVLDASTSNAADRVRREPLQQAEQRARHVRGPEGKRAERRRRLPRDGRLPPRAPGRAGPERVPAEPWPIRARWARPATAR